MKRSSIRFSILVVVVAILGARAVPAQEPGTKAAQTATEAWLSLVDNQSYAASWDAAAGMFRNAVTQEKWEAAAKAARGPLGAMKSRALFQFDASFEHKAAAVETVTAMKEKDGTWHVGGYFIK